jgi:hypothetical protein
MMAVLDIDEDSALVTKDIFMPPDHKMSGELCHGLCVGGRKHLVSVNYRTSAWVD